MSALQSSPAARPDPLAWARALWRDVLAAELTPEEQATGPRAFSRRK